MIDKATILDSQGAATDKDTARSIVFGQLDAVTFEQCDVRLVNDFVLVSGVYTFEVQRQPQNRATCSIMVVPVPRPPDSGPLPPAPGRLLEEPIATISVEEGQLCLTWNPENPTVHAAELANAMIRLEWQGEQHTIGLREPVELEAIALDLENPLQRVPIEVKNLPSAGDLSIVMRPIDGIDVPFEFAGGQATIERGDSQKVRREGSIPSELEIELAEVKEGAELRVRASYFDSRKRRKPLVGDSIRSTAIGLQRSQSESESNLAAARSAIPRIESEAARLRSRRPSDNSEAAAISGRLVALKQQHTKARSSIRRYEKSLPKIAESIEDLK
ncbi:hypothetical protein [Aeoliella sp. SH292]|uniref:hypothetical protein n=1 Tax=Aeoliella sp. SH292 TaxID=3454464 RepID=UPI003F9B48AC